MRSNGRPLTSIAAVDLLTVGVTAAATQARTGFYSPRPVRIDDLAHRLERSTRHLDAVIDSRCTHFPGYRQLRDEVDVMLCEADHIHDVADRGGSRWHLRSDVDRFERHLDEVADLARRVLPPHRWDHDDSFEVREALARTREAASRLCNELN
jgi:hypothetical protein